MPRYSSRKKKYKRSKSRQKYKRSKSRQKYKRKTKTRSRSKKRSKRKSSSRRSRLASFKARSIRLSRSLTNKNWNIISTLDCPSGWVQKFTKTGRIICVQK